MLEILYNTLFILTNPLSMIFIIAILGYMMLNDFGEASSLGKVIRRKDISELNDTEKRARVKSLKDRKTLNRRFKIFAVILVVYCFAIFQTGNVKIAVDNQKLDRSYYKTFRAINFDKVEDVYDFFKETLDAKVDINLDECQLVNFGVSTKFIASFNCPDEKSVYIEKPESHFWRVSVFNHHLPLVDNFALTKELLFEVLGENEIFSRAALSLPVNDRKGLYMNFFSRIKTNDIEELKRRVVVGDRPSQEHVTIMRISEEGLQLEIYYITE